MKKGILLSFVFLLKIAVFNVSSQEFIKTATVYMPEKTYQIEYLYNKESKELVGYQKNIQKATAWENSEWVTWERNVSGQKTLETTKIWQSSAWKISQEIAFVYDAAGNKIEETLSVANASGVLENSTRTQWTYEGGVLKNVKVDQWLNAVWAPQSFSELIYSGSQLVQVNFGSYIAGTLNPVSREIFVYNASGQLESQTLQTKIAGSDPAEFVNETQDLFFYSEYGSEILKDSQKWNSELNEWEKTVRMESEYDYIGNLTVRTLQNFGQAWDNVTQEIYTYDSGGRVLSKQFRSWIFEMWLDIFNENYVYNDDGNTQTAEFNRMFWTGTLAPQVAEFMPLSYNNSAGVASPPQTDLLSAYAINVTYTDADNLLTGGSNLSDDLNAALQISMYPNPSSDGYFYFNSLEVTLLSYEVYDMSGRLIVSRSTNDGYIDLSHVPAGLYNAVLHTDAGQAVRKLIRK